MKLFHFLTTSSLAETSEAAEQSPTHPVFWVIVGVIAIGFAIMIVQNFVIKKEEYYK